MMDWTTLPLPTSAAVDLPPLLISSRFQQNAYTIHLTDLSHIWSESLDRDQILHRSRDENTSIDPSSSPDQFAILLKKIRSALAGEKDTACSMTIVSGDGKPRLDLGLTVQLPGGLAPLEWDIKLSPSADSALRSQLIMPLLRTQHSQDKEIDGLRDTIRDKDHVIQKLVDKLESMGTDLGQVFAQAAGKPGRKGEWNRDRVKGMPVFDYHQWKLLLREDRPLGVPELLKETFPQLDKQNSLVIAPRVSEDVGTEAWWTTIGGLTISLSSGKVSTSRVTNARSRKTRSQEDRARSPVSPPVAEKIPSLSGQTSKIEDSAFEPHVVPPVDDNDNDTDEDDDLDAPSQRDASRNSSSAQPAVKSKKSFGKIGGKKRIISPPNVSPEESLSQGQLSTAHVTTDATATEKTAIDASSKPKKKLGQVGGTKKKESTQIIEPNTTEEQAPAQLPQTPKKKLGIIGHKKDTPVKEEQEQPRGRAPVKLEQSVTPPPRETSDERADRKREQLKRELEQRAKAPVKKKRKL